MAVLTGHVEIHHLELLLSTGKLQKNEAISLSNSLRMLVPA